MIEANPGIRFFLVITQST
uniref:Uncharacterized protein n=1 Tax=Medicago truncatula TaxID=3880 RepID=I3STW5_MEDTR|nr:unknown [Medicago truncatula]